MKYKTSIMDKSEHPKNNPKRPPRSAMTVNLKI